MNLRSAIRAALLPNAHLTAVIAERARCCPRPNLIPVGCPEWLTRADYEYWARVAARFVSKNPDNVDGWIVLGHSRFHLDDFKGACKAYRVAVRLEDNADMWFSLGLCASGEEAIAAYRAALQHDRLDDMSWHYLANALADARSYEEAIQCFRIAVEHSDDSSAAWVLCDLALCYLATHLTEDSIATFERSVHADGGYAFDTMVGNIADACLNEPPDFVHALHAHLMPISPDCADKVLRFWNTRWAKKCEGEIK